MGRKEILSCRGVCAGGKYGLDFLQMELYESESLLVLGNCSSGKEILKEVLIGQEKNYSGRFYWEEDPIDEKNMQGIIQRHQIFYANPDRVLIEGYTIAENIYIARSGKRGVLPSRKAMDIQTGKLLKELGFSLSPETYVRELDYFEKMLVCFAKAVSYQSRVILFDHTVNTLRADQMHFLKDFLEKQKKNGTSFLIFSEKFDEAHRICDRVLIMSEGRDKKAADIDQIATDEISCYWLGEAYKKNRPRAAESAPVLKRETQGGGTDDGGGNILGIFDRDWGGEQKNDGYLEKLYENNREKLQEYYSVFFEKIIGNRQFVYIENRKYDEMLGRFPLSHNLLVPRNLKELFSFTNKMRDSVMVKEFYREFDFLQNRTRQYSDYFFYRLVAIYRFERFHKELMVLDNPFLQLDIMEENYMREYLERLAKKMKLVIISHRRHEIDILAKNIVYVEDGKVVYTDRMTG